MARLSITFSANRAKAQPYVNQFAAQGITATEGMVRLRAAGISYRRTDFLADVRYFSGAQRSGTYVRSIPRRGRFNPDRLETVRGTIPKRYRFIVENDVLLVDGRRKKITVAVDDDDINTRGQIESTAMEDVGDEEKYEDVAEVLESRIVEGWVSGAT
ncbi:hypothetical protein LCGC14_1807150 [marine sediment metagenome]|uniref:Uncharacterized protein n=1 Tax=marine sediment metagenome TaxID=412755 RepID=A0A0F9HAS7_9ZZZZ